MRPRIRSLAVTLAALALVPALAAAQTGIQTGKQALAAMPAPGRRVVEALAGLEQLPAPAWRTHAGDLPHAEEPDLDDASWPLLLPGARAGRGPVWMRATVTVPRLLSGYDLTGSRIWFEMNVHANGPVPEIVYLNGRRVAMGEDLEPLVLLEQAQPGDRVSIAVKLLDTVDDKTFAGTSLRIDFAPGRPDPRRMREQLSVASILAPSLSPAPREALARIGQAAAEIDLGALGRGRQPEFDASLQRAQATLDPLAPLLRQTSWHLTGNSHIDAAWLWPATETVDVVRRTFATALQLMREYPQYTYTQSAAQYNEWMAEKYPAIDAEIRRRIEEGRWEVVGGMWVEPDLNMPDGEALARSLLIGKRWYRQHYGVDVRVGWNPDSFGYNWQLPQIYRKSGIDFFVTQKMAWNDTNQLPFKLFWWESPDGSRVLTYFPHDYANTDLDPLRLALDLGNARRLSPGLSRMMDLYGVGDHGGGPTRAILDQGVRDARPDSVFPRTEFGTAAAFFDAVAAQLAPASPAWNYGSIAAGYRPPAPVPGRVSIPTWKDELYLEYHRGVFTTQAAQKRNMRRSVVEAINAETFAAFAWLHGETYPQQELTEDWKKIAFNDFHDLAAGSGIAAIYRDAQSDYQRVHLSTAAIEDRSLGRLASAIDTGSRPGVALLVANPLAWERGGVLRVTVQMPQPAAQVAVVDPSGRVLPSQVLSTDRQTGSTQLLIDVARVPSLGYTVLHVLPGGRKQSDPAPRRRVTVNGTTLENDSLRATVDPHSGCLTSLYDKRAGFEALSPGSCGNLLQAFADHPRDYDAWNIDPGTLERPPAELTRADSVTVTEQTPLAAAIRVTRSWQGSKFVQTLRLESGADQLAVDNDFDWQQSHVLLKAAFDLAAAGSSATYEIPYGSIERPTTRGNSWEQARFEVPALRWADLGDGSHGLSLINDSKYGYDAVGNRLRLTLLRSPTWPDPGADRGRQQFRYALYPHAGSWKQARTVRHGYEFNNPLIARQVAPHPGTLPAEQSLLSVEQDHVVLTAVKKAEDSDALILHLYEWAGEGGDIDIRLPAGARSAALSNLVEQQAGAALPLAGSRLRVPIHPYEIVTINVGYSPAAVEGR